MERLDKNILFNLLSYTVVALSGVAINVMIWSLYGTEVLGRFNLLFTFLIIGAQLGVGGVQFSVLRHNSAFRKRPRILGQVMTSALGVVTLFSFGVVASAWCGGDLLMAVWSEYAPVEGTVLLAPAVILFAWNKILLMGVNGIGYMRAFAFFNAQRFVLLMVCVFGFYLLNGPVSQIALVFVLTEAVMTLCMGGYFFMKAVTPAWPTVAWVRRHVGFGLRGFGGGALMEINTRTDILMLGIMMSERAVGIYSFASTIAEGFAQLFTVLKNNVDPLFGEALFRRNIIRVNEVIAGVRRKYVPLLVLAGGAVIAGFPFLFSLVITNDSEGLGESWHVLVILIAFMGLASVYKPFSGLLNQMGKPGTFSWVITSTLALNVGLNLLLIPLWGLYGAALATGAAFFVESFFLYNVAKRHCLRMERREEVEEGRNGDD